MTAAVADARYAVPPNMGIHRSVMPLNEIERVRGFVTWVLGGRADPPEGKDEANWSTNLGTLYRGKILSNPNFVLGFLGDTAIPELCRQALGPDIVYSLDKTLVRDFNPSRRPAPARMHFDAHLYGPQVPMVTVWIPLNDVGIESPGLSIATRPNSPLALWNELAEGVDAAGRYHAGAVRQRDYAHEDLYAMARAEPESPFIEPELNAGDVMIFDHQYVHGTQTSIASPTRRMSLEIRMLAADVAKRVMALGTQHMFVRVD